MQSKGLLRTSVIPLACLNYVLASQYVHCITVSRDRGWKKPGPFARNPRQSQQAMSVYSAADAGESEYSSLEILHLGL